MNICVLMGRLTRDPEMRYSQQGQGQGVGRFSIAVDRRFKREGQPDADFFDCVCFGRQAEFMEKYLKKGTKVVINGSIQNNNYQDRNGQMVYRQQIICDNIEFAESKKAAEGSQQTAQAAGQPKQNYGQTQKAPAGQSQQQYAAPAPVATPSSDYDGFMNIPDGIEEELPFN